ncbi:hypothetical protein [Kerstersia gyiorum]|uniref:hypothetical protein n=1 Tax=Kerstersia gyiorum TaxID=206506 RepID=UPI0020A02125|nr:hypothetical protein [Kerstersia gyiorum]MCP1679409.1 hypothetical protein [Kerstersia gyiorum]MCP1823912.1 hypothetical protein [Kerstersia gyiorum]MCP1827353.1 hypothetical protein [Kerstersia gyiorum]MCW2448998.1 hypothetical protein [Kerstersia gyiorum]
MAIDTSIYSKVSPGADLSNLPQTLMQLGQMSRNVRAADKAEAREKTIGDLFKTNMGDDGSLNREGFSSGLAQAGYGSDLPAFQKQWADQDKAKADARVADFDFQKKRIDYINGALQSLLSRQNVTTDDAIGVITGMVQQGLIDPEEGAMQARALPSDPVALRQYLLQAGMTTLEAKHRMDALTPQVSAQNLGGHTQMVDTNALTNPGVVGQTFQRSMTPGEAESARHNRVIEGQAAQRIAMDRDQPVGAPIEVTENGVPVLVQRYSSGRLERVQGFSPKASGDGFSIETNPDGTVRVSRGANMPKLTEQQSKDLVYLTRAESAIETLNRLESQLADPTQRTTASIPLVGNATVSPEFQQARQAGEDFLAAVLRKDTGAAITNQEIDIYGRMYLPQPFDSPEVLAQKAQARRTVLDAMRTGLGSVGQFAPPAGGQQPAQPDTPPAPTWQQAGFSSQAQAVAEARNALHRGKDKAAVIQRLESMGITDHGIR